MAAARLHFRPTIMTSMAFVFGVIPLAISSGGMSLATLYRAAAAEIHDKPGTTT